MKLIARFSPEVSIKSPKVKSRFVSRLVGNIKEAMASTGHQIEVTKEWSRLILDVTLKYFC